MPDVISLRYPSTARVDAYGTSEVHPPYPAQAHTAAWMHAQLGPAAMVDPAADRLVRDDAAVATNQAPSRCGETGNHSAYTR